MLRRHEAGNEPDWASLWDLEMEHWRSDIEERRQRDEMVNDDCTLLAVRPAL
jgi:hypothetical protein